MWNRTQGSFQKGNRRDFELDLEVAPLSSVNDEDGSLDELKKSLFEITPSLFAFSQSHYVGLNKLIFCKVFSPDFFIHMNPGLGNNNQIAGWQKFRGANPYV